MNGAALWELQQLDTALDQLQRRLTKLPEAAELANAEHRSREHRAAVAAATTQLNDAEATIETIEHESEALTARRARLEQQLKIVTETRQADALDHQIDTLNPLKIVVSEWASLLRDLRSARDLREAIGYAFGKPGWGPGHTARSAPVAPEPLHG